MKQVNSLLFRELNSLLAREIAEGGKNDFLISITKVETGRDLRNARVFYLVYPNKFASSTKKFLESRARDWQNMLGKKLTLKYKPKFSFVFDKGQENAFLVEEIIQKGKI